MDSEILTAYVYYKMNYWLWTYEAVWKWWCCSRV